MQKHERLIRFIDAMQMDENKVSVTLSIKRVKEPRLLLNHKLYSFNCFVLNDSFPNIFVHQTKGQKKITTQYFFSLASQTKNNFYTFTTTQPFVCNTLYIIRILRMYSNILYRCEEEAKN
jgi:hypothetical protein